MFIDGVYIDLDVEDYLRSKGQRGIKRTGDNVMVCCPFHHEGKPSFGVNVESGVYNCFGCGAKGSFSMLVKHLEKFDTVWDAEQHILRTFGRLQVSVTEPLVLNFADPTLPQRLDDSILAPLLEYRHEYIEQRGIRRGWQKNFEIGYDKERRAITFPWRDERGRLVTVKYRSVRSKYFWFEPAGEKSNVVYALNHVKRRGEKLVCITEGEIDCISVWQAGLPAVALGGSDISDTQIRLLLNSPIEELVIFTDNDAAGEKARSKLTSALSGHKRLSVVGWQLYPDKKDANDLTSDEITRLVAERKPCKLDTFSIPSM